MMLKTMLLAAVTALAMGSAVNAAPSQTKFVISGFDGNRLISWSLPLPTEESTPPTFIDAEEGFAYFGTTVYFNGRQGVRYTAGDFSSFLISLPDNPIVPLTRILLDSPAVRGVDIFDFEFGAVNGTFNVRDISFNVGVYQGVGLNSSLALTITETPEPAALALLGMGVLGVAARRGRRKR